MTTTAIKPMQAQNANTPMVIKPNEQIQIIKSWTQDLDELTRTQAFNLTPEEHNFGVSIITGLVDRCVKDKIDVRQLNMTNFLEQVKHNSKMQFSLQEQDIFLDIRNNSSTGLKDITIRKQYQGVQKVMRRYCTKKIVRFADGIVYKGDTFEYGLDFATGLNKITYKQNPNTDHSRLENVTHAFAIAYVDEMKTLVPYVCVIDKARIMRAFNASAAKDKGPWSTDTARMVRKTAYWCLYNDIFKPFIEIPSDLQTSFAATEDEMDFNNTETQEPADDNVYDIPTDENTTDFVVEPETEQPQEQSFIDYLDEQDAKGQADVQEVYYSEYKNNKEKYNMVEGSYDAVKKTVKVTLK